jgi:2-methylcitrate dehydratase PrpD
VGTYLDAEAASFRDPAVQAMSERMRMVQDPECTFENPLGRVTLRLRDGRALSDSAFAPGSPGNPVTRADIERKFRHLVSRDFGDRVADESLDLIMNLEQVSNVGQITRLFAGARA